MALKCIESLVAAPPPQSISQSYAGLTLARGRCFAIFASGGELVQPPCHFQTKSLSHGRRNVWNIVGAWVQDVGAWVHQHHTSMVGTNFRGGGK